MSRELRLTTLLRSGIEIIRLLSPSKSKRMNAKRTLMSSTKFTMFKKTQCRMSRMKKTFCFQGLSKNVFATQTADTFKSFTNSRCKYLRRSVERFYTSCLSFSMAKMIRMSSSTPGMQFVRWWTGLKSSSRSATTSTFRRIFSSGKLICSSLR